ETTVNPAETTVNPAETTVNPAETTVNPAETTVNPAETTVNPAETTVNPAETTASNTSETTDPFHPGTETTPNPGTGTTAQNIKVVTSYSISFTPPTRVNYWSHDTRSFKESGGLKGLAASLTLYKFYVNENNEVCDALGNPMHAPNGTVFTYSADGTGTATTAQAFDTKNIDITGETHPLYTENSPSMVWENEIKAQLGSNYTPMQALQAKHANKYPMRAYFHPTESTDEDAKMLGTDPIYLGDFNIFIGVKGDYNLDNVVSADDAQSTLRFYTNYYVAGNTDYKLSDNPEFDGEDGLIFYLVNVRYRDGSKATDPIENPLKVAADDAQCILKYYTWKTVSGHDDYTWEDAVGYDLLDKFYGDSYED
ncbi:MAG: hypothetical protein IKX57_06230, partial [Oscillospiraceae bacterium]|nr:hypothetical protein [Oscillospiraceae bacterium]